MDFLVVDIKITKELSQVPIILRRPFLTTTKAIADSGKGEVILKVGKHIVKVDIKKLVKYLMDTMWPIRQLHFHVSRLYSLSLMCDVCNKVY